VVIAFTSNYDLGHSAAKSKSITAHTAPAEIRAGRERPSFGYGLARVNALKGAL
jgi:hypothetical protein